MRAAANELNVPMQIVNGPELVSALAGQSEAAVRDILYRARENAPSIVFFDEIDALASKDSMKTPEVSRAVSQFLTEMDGLRPKDKVIIIATTNRPQTLDPALLTARAVRQDLLRAAARPRGAPGHLPDPPQRRTDRHRDRLRRAREADRGLLGRGHREHRRRGEAHRPEGAARYRDRTRRRRRRGFGALRDERCSAFGREPDRHRAGESRRRDPHGEPARRRGQDEVEHHARDPRLGPGVHPSYGTRG